MTKEEAIAKIREIYKDEKFRMDALFFCGFPSGMPNEKLMKACERYLGALDAGEPTADAAAALTAELEAAVTAKTKSAKVDNIIDNLESVRELLAHKELL